MAEKFLTLVDLCEKSCAKFTANQLFGTKTAAGWTWITYGEFKKDVDRFRGALAALGVGPGDKVGIIADNRVEWAVACYATYGLRASYVPMYQAQLPKEWEFILDDCGAKVCIAATNDIYEALGEIRKNVASLQHVIGLDLKADHEASYAAMLKKGDESPAEVQTPDPSEIAGLIYTSGTTGKPKGVMLSHANLAENINAIKRWFAFEPGDRSLSFLPWAHSFGQVVELHGLLSDGCSMGINDEIPNLVGNLAEVKPTILFAVPRIFNRIYDGVNKQMTEKPGFIQTLFRTAIRAATKKGRGQAVGVMEGMALSIADKIIFSKIREKFGGRLKYAISGSAALSTEVAEFIDALGIDVYEGYGLTETSPIATANYPGHRKIGSVGKAIEGVKIVIDKEATGDAVNGEIIVYGHNVMQGYHNRPEENALVMMPDGGFRTGDMGRVDDDGFVYITGRIKEQYKLENGKYVVPSPLEEEIKLSPFIANVMIYGDNKPHNVALVVLDMEAVKKWGAEHGVTSDFAKNDKVRSLVQQELDARCASFKGYEKPKTFTLVEEDFTTDNGLLTPTMKLKRRNVMEKYGDALTSLY